jgi:glycosyltransferase involved in cell wall biosynthesis
MLSVVMAVFNDQHYLEESIQSILDQTFKDFDFIIIDDYSTDNSLSIIKYFAQKDSRISIIENKRNLGLAASLNKGIKRSTGKYIARMDADDISLSTRLQKQLNFMENNPNVDIVGTGITYIDEQGGFLKEIYMSQYHKNIEREICKKSPFAHPTVMIKRSFFDVVGFYDESLRKKQDYDLWVRGLKYCEYSNIQECLLEYRYFPVKSIKTDFYGYLVRLKNFKTLKDVRCLYYAHLVLVLNIIGRVIGRD